MFPFISRVLLAYWKVPFLFRVNIFQRRNSNSLLHSGGLHLSTQKMPPDCLKGSGEELLQGPLLLSAALCSEFDKQISFFSHLEMQLHFHWFVSTALFGAFLYHFFMVSPFFHLRMAFDSQSSVDPRHWKLQLSSYHI